jgi:hypothetical protein
MWAVAGLAAVVIILLLLPAPFRAGRPSLAGIPRPVSLCLLVRNAADRLEGLVGELVRTADALGATVADVVVVDDASADGSAALLGLLQRRYPGIKVLLWPDDTGGRGHVLEAALTLCAGRCVVLRQVRPGAATACR